MSSGKGEATNRRNLSYREYLLFSVSVKGREGRAGFSGFPGPIVSISLINEFNLVDCEVVMML